MISIIIPIYNKQDCIRATLMSVLGQTYEDYEIICIDDGSTDKSIEVVRSICSNKIQVYSKTNGGVSSARNEGLKRAQGDWLYFLDADDIMLPNALKDLLDATKVRETNFVLSNFYIKSKATKYYCKHDFKPFYGNIYKNVIKNKCLPRTGNILIKKSACEGIFFNEMYSKNEDIDFFIRLIKNSKGMIIPTPSMVYELANSSLSKQQGAHHKDYCYNINISKHSFYIKVYLGMTLWDACFTDFISKWGATHLRLILLGFGPFIYRSLRYKLSNNESM